MYPIATQLWKHPLTVLVQQQSLTPSGGTKRKFGTGYGRKDEVVGLEDMWPTFLILG